jgi:hypothetical protein
MKKLALFKKFFEKKHHFLGVWVFEVLFNAVSDVDWAANLVSNKTRKNILMEKSTDPIN